MKHVFRVWLIICCLFTLSAGHTENYTADVINESIGGIIAYNLKIHEADSLQMLVDSYLADTAGTGAEWYIISLVEAGYQLDYSLYSKNLNTYIKSHSNIGATGRQRIALAAAAFGNNDSYITDTPDATIGKLGIMSYVYGLHLLNNGLESKDYSANTIADTIISLQNDDGGWAVTGNISDVDVTAMVLQSLAPLYGSDARINKACASALDLLSERQLPDGGYQSYGVENAESCAQVLIALTAHNIDFNSDPRFLKEGSSVLDALLRFHLDDGSFSHIYEGKSNPTATAQALMSLVAINKYLGNYGPLFILNQHPLITAKVTVSYKVYACIAVSTVLVLALIILYCTGKRSTKNYVFALIIAVLLNTIIICTDFSSVENFYQINDSELQITGSATISINCGLLTDIRSDLPENGIILSPSIFDISDNTTVYDVLITACRKNSIQIESTGSGMGYAGLEYVSGIDYIYEYDYGDLSGWMYRVNGITPSIGCGEYILTDGDVIEWIYTRELGRDLELLP